MNIAMFNNELVALTETPIPLKLDTQSLQTKGTFTFDDAIDAQFSSSHLLFDSTANEWVGVAIHFSHNSDYIIYKMAANSNKRIPITTISVGYPAYMHSFALTPNYIILTEAPLTVSPYDLLLSDHSFIGTFQWQPKNGTHFMVINRKTGKKVGSFKTETFFTLHHVNAFEKDGHLIIDLVAYKDSDIVTSGFNYKNMHSANAHLPQAYLKRYSINLASKSVSGTQLSPFAIELPQINQAKLMHEQRYVYAATGKNGIAQEIIKLDLHLKSHHSWHCKDCYVTEPIFVAKPGSHEEDDGVLLCLVLDANAKKSFLVILNAKNMHEIARTWVDHHIPFTVHSKFFGNLPK